MKEHIEPPGELESCTEALKRGESTTRRVRIEATPDGELAV